VRAFLGLGSNLGDREAYLREAVGSLSNVVAVSPVYETDPVGGPGGQGAYLNIVVEIDTDLTPRQLLGVCHRLESAAGRVREERWGPRTLDVDILWHERGPIVEPDLEVPHPRMAERRFVMAPFADLAPDLVDPDWNDRAEGRVRQVGTLAG
jgi:2-amino-4-hydroxy-6-hydroxymethyldihydropteridine diphosphokinase